MTAENRRKSGSKRAKITDSMIDPDLTTADIARQAGGLVTLQDAVSKNHFFPIFFDFILFLCRIRACFGTLRLCLIIYIQCSTALPWY